MISFVTCEGQWTKETDKMKWIYGKLRQMLYKVNINAFLKINQRYFPIEFKDVVITHEHLCKKFSSNMMIAF